MFVFIKMRLPRSCFTFIIFISFATATVTVPNSSALFSRIILYFSCSNSLCVHSFLHGSRDFHSLAHLAKPSRVYCCTVCSACMIVYAMLYLMFATTSLTYFEYVFFRTRNGKRDFFPSKNSIELNEKQQKNLNSFREWKK